VSALGAARRRPGHSAGVAAARRPADALPSRRAWPPSLAGRSLAALLPAALPLAVLSLAALLPPVVAQAQPAPVAPAEPAPGVPAAPSASVAAPPVEPVAAAEETVLLDRVAVRFTAPETGGIARPQFIFERELAFEARLEALTDGGFRQTPEAPYLERHVRAALERHMAEVLLENLEVTPEPTPRDIELRIRSARLTLQQQLGGAAELDRASQAENISATEVARLLRRRARASLYLDRMVATMLTPSDTELRIVHRTTRTPFSGADYESVAPLLSRWYVAQRLNTAVRAFYEGARSRLRVTLLVGTAKGLGALPGERTEREPDMAAGSER